MKLLRTAPAIAVALAALAVGAALLLGSEDEPPRSFFGIAPQTPLTEADGGI